MEEIEKNDDEIEEKYLKLKEKIGEEEFNRVLKYLFQNINASIDDIYDETKGYDKEKIDDFFETTEEITDQAWIEHLISINNDVGNLKEFIENLNKTKEGKDQEFVSYKSKSRSK